MTDVRHIVFSSKTHRKDANSNSSTSHRQVLGAGAVIAEWVLEIDHGNSFPANVRGLCSVPPSSFLSRVRRNESISQLRFTACVTGCRGLSANSEILHTSEMSPQCPPHFITYFCFLSPAYAIHSSIVSAVPKTTPQTQEQAAVRGQEGRMPSPCSTLACGLTSAVLFHMFLLSAMSHTSPAPPPHFFVPHFPEEVVSVVGCRGASKGDPDLNHDAMELVVCPLPVPPGP